MTAPEKLDLAILVPTFDGIAEVWPIFIEAFRQFWPHCPYPLYFGTNSLDVDNPMVRTIKVGPDCGYASTIIAMLDSVKTRWVLLCMEDFPFSGPVDEVAIHRLTEFAEANNAALVNLIVMPEEMASLFERPLIGGQLAEIKAGDPYCVALGGGLWRTEALRQCLVGGESAWQIERVASWRMRNSGLRFFRLGPKLRGTPPLPVVNLIQSGMWTKEGYNFVRQLGLKVDLTIRPVEPLIRRVWLSAYQTIRFIAASAFIMVGRGPARRFLAHTVGQQRITIQN